MRSNHYWQIEVEEFQQYQGFGKVMLRRSRLLFKTKFKVGRDENAILTEDAAKDAHAKICDAFPKPDYQVTLREVRTTVERVSKIVVIPTSGIM